MLIATGFYSGYLPKAPGTWGSLVGVLLVFLLHALSLQIYLSVIAGLFIVGSFVAGEAEKILDNRDPGVVVIDEIVGMLITMIAVPVTPLTMALGFILFRVFDIAKPFPVNFFDQHFHGGLGIMLDDVVAGIYSLIIMQLIFLLAF
ncbi:MAG: phosphatidylglycerophosphatase A [Desulfobulbaceae bacterium]|jgi:phosphatidylglycerophosphatase A|nr:phosphatidylglycerophosphatase A [Desulfobulbaceae bacterium]MDH3542408.1 phosphatidylglycerophosphatase A [Desulfobulbaceae bacterium]MDH3782926.1 phosphatidylglycerophosphatase A [Desulfobulbaceae bacterium]HKJ14940.1 phosphatidylglycerophosphatase A [Desulfobulbales bacterium]